MRKGVGRHDRGRRVEREREREREGGRESESTRDIHVQSPVGGLGW